MRNYWTCSRFADWLRGTPKLNSGTSEEWSTWKKTAKSAHPFRYWLAEEALGDLDDLWNYIPSKISSVRYYIDNRFLTKTHVLSSSLSKGQWHEFEERVLHSMFDTFVDFIEIETAWSHCMWNDDAQKKYNMPWWRGQWYTRWFRRWRCAEAGVAHLEWEMTLKYNEDWIKKTDPLYGKPTPQAEAAKEKWALYYWWTSVRPHRADVYDYSGWSAYCEEREKANPDGWVFENNKSKKDKKRTKELLEAMRKLEEQYDAEDEEMLIRLIKLRKSLWT
jgi:hypothetical protein